MLQAATRTRSDGPHARRFGSEILLRVASGRRVDEVDGRRRTSPVFCRLSSAKRPLGSWIREQERTRSSDPSPTDGGNPYQSGNGPAGFTTRIMWSVNL